MMFSLEIKPHLIVYGGVVSFQKLNSVACAVLRANCKVQDLDPIWMDATLVWGLCDSVLSLITNILQPIYEFGSYMLYTLEWTLSL